MSWLLLRLETY